MLENILASVLLLIVSQFRGKMHDFFARVGDKLNDKIEGTATQLDDIAKTELVDALKTAFIPQLEVDGVDGPVEAGASA